VIIGTDRDRKTGAIRALLAQADQNGLAYAGAAFLFPRLFPVTTIQRLYSMLEGEAEFDGGNEEGSAFDTTKPWQGVPPNVVYNPGIPPEFFDFIIIDECHRSIYELWSEVLSAAECPRNSRHRHSGSAGSPSLRASDLG
jgi:hypothetical protein